MIRWGWLCCFLLAGGISSRAETSSDAWLALQAVVETSCQFPSEKVVLSYDPAKRLLKVGRELQLNKVTLRRHIQVVPIDRLKREIPIEGVGRMADPWVKIRTRDGRNHVQVTIEREINGESADFEIPEGDQPAQAFLIVPCTPKDIKKLRDALQAFLQAEQKS